MSARRKEKKELIAKHNPPINFTCGGCKRVQKFDSKNPYFCKDCPYIEAAKNGE